MIFSVNRVFHFIFSLILHLILIKYICMKKLIKYMTVTAAVVILTTISTGCFRQEYMFEDGDFDGIEFSDYDLIQNAELDMDDLDRN